MESKEISIIASIVLLIAIFFFAYELLNTKKNKLIKIVSWSSLAIAVVTSVCSLVILCIYKGFNTVYNNEIVINVETSILIVMLSLIFANLFIYSNKIWDIDNSKPINSKTKKELNCAKTINVICTFSFYLLFVLTIVILILTEYKVWIGNRPSVNWRDGLKYTAPLGYVFITLSSLLISLAISWIIMELWFIVKTNSRNYSAYILVVIKMLGYVASYLAALFLGLGFLNISKGSTWFNMQLINIMTVSYTNVLFYTTLYLSVFGLFFNSLPFISKDYLIERKGNK